jgi:hypothetical protein
VLATSSAVLVVVSPARFQAWCRGWFERYPTARAFTFAFDYELMTNPARAWVLRVFGFGFVAVAAFAPRALTGLVRGHL